MTLLRAKPILNAYLLVRASSDYVPHMAPLLKPSDCILLVIEPVAKDIAAPDTHPPLLKSREQIEEAASLCAVPQFLAAPASLQVRPAPSARSRATSKEVTYTLELASQAWPETPLGAALAATGRPCILLCGLWLDDCVSFAALKVYAEGYDTYVLTDATQSLNQDSHEPALSRLVQAGIVPTTVGQAIREWAFLEIDLLLTRQLLHLVGCPDERN